jgi:hypothetical protein
VLDRSSRTDATFSRNDFAFDPERDRLHKSAAARRQLDQLSPISVAVEQRPITQKILC